VSYFAVIREAGPAWTDGNGIAAQSALAEHAAFMNTLADEGFVLFGGPLAGSEHERLRALLIVRADSEVEIHRRLADDPWTRADRLVIASIESWMIMTGAERLSSAPRHAGRARPLRSVRPDEVNRGIEVGRLSQWAHVSRARRPRALSIRSSSGVPPSPSPVA
jgi:uncharacterized protein YciI